MIWHMAVVVSRGRDVHPAGGDSYTSAYILIERQSTLWRCKNVGCPCGIPMMPQCRRRRRPLNNLTWGMSHHPIASRVDRMKGAVSHVCFGHVSRTRRLCVVCVSTWFF